MVLHHVNSLLTRLKKKKKKKKKKPFLSILVRNEGIQLWWFWVYISCMRHEGLQPRSSGEGDQWREVVSGDNEGGGGGGVFM